MKISEIKNKIVVLSTVNQDKPYSIAVEVNKIDGKQIIITDNYMYTVIENIKNNPNVCIVYHDNKNGIRINGKAKYYNSGKWLEFVKKLPENEGMPAKGAVVIEIQEIKELG